MGKPNFRECCDTYFSRAAELPVWFIQQFTMNGSSRSALETYWQMEEDRRAEVLDALCDAIDALPKQFLNS